MGAPPTSLAGGGSEPAVRVPPYRLGTVGREAGAAPAEGTMLITRKIGKVVRGGVTPMQVMMACVLGGVLGFIPGFWQAPGLLVGAILILILVNANLFLVGAVTLLAKMVSLAVMPVQFGVGQVMLDGPTRPIFQAAINAPVLALAGLEHYATTGGLVLGIVFGVAVGVVLIRLLGGLWRRLAAIEEGSERYKKVAGKKSVRLLSFIFLGSKKGSYAEIAAKKFGNPIRPLGAVFAILVAALLGLVYLLAGEPITTAIVQRGLERAHGATVDVESAKFDLAAGKFTITGLAMADPKDLTTDLLRARWIEGDIGEADLLRKRLALDEVVVSEASQGEKRAFPGRLLRPRPEPAPPPPPSAGKTIDDYLREAEVWKERLAQVRRWLEELRGPEEEAPATGEDGKPVVVQKDETLRERLEREVAELGYKNVRATHLIEGAPTLLVRRLVAEGVRSREFGEEPLDITAENLSTHPSLVGEPPRVRVASRQGTLLADLDLGVAKTPAPARVEVALRGLSTDRVAGWLVPTDPPLIQGGTTDLRLAGTIGAGGLGSIDLPLTVTLRNAVVSLPRAGSANVAEFILPVGVKGSLDNPAIVVDSGQLSDALVKAGAGELANKARAEADKQIDKALEKVTEKLGAEVGGEIGEKAKDALKGLFPGR